MLYKLVVIAQGKWVYHCIAVQKVHQTESGIEPLIVVNDTSNSITSLYTTSYEAGDDAFDGQFTTPTISSRQP